MMMRSLPLRAALFAALALAVLATALAVAIGWQANRALSERTLADVADEIADLTAAHASGGAAALEARVAQRLANDATGARILHLVDPDGRTRAGSFHGGGGLDLDAIARSVTFTYRAPREQSPRLAAGRVVRLGTPPLTLLVARDIADQRHLAFRIQVIALGGLVLLGGVTVAAGFAARRLMLARIETITTTAQAIMAGKLAERVPRDASGDEIDTLAATLNDMLARIDGLMQALREVSDNIAHDLKTPISRLRNTAEQALRTPGAHQRDALGAVIEQSDGIIQTFNALLQIARLEHGASDLPRDTLDLAQMMTDVVELYEPVAETLNLTLRQAAASATPFNGNRQLLGQALANLLDNALKYAADDGGDPEHRRVDITLETTPTQHRLIVSDLGPGIAVEDRDKALKRFGRLDASRTLPGTGLGLSMVSAIARLHGGALLLESNEPRGLKAVLALPRRGTTAG